MKSEELYQEYVMSYSELVQYLLVKYGPSECDYFKDERCSKINHGAIRTLHGLYCHHIDEDKGINLSEPSFAKLQPFEYQKKERLIYCNLLEHLVLHIKIAILRERKLKQKHVSADAGVKFICRTLNDIYAFGGGLKESEKRCAAMVSENVEDYFRIIAIFLGYMEIQHDFLGEKLIDEMEAMVRVLSSGKTNINFYPGIYKKLCNYELSKEDKNIIRALSKK